MNDNTFGSYLRRDIVYYTIILVFGLYSFRLFQMQIMDTPIYEEKSEENSIKSVMLDAPRGVIYDRNFSYLVSNKPSYSIEVTPSFYDGSADGILESKLSLDSGQVSSILERYKGYPSHFPRKIFKKAEFSSIVWLEENKVDLPGIGYTMDLARDYSFGVLGSHMFGYIREIDAQQLQKMRETYDMGDYIGYSGIEKTYEYLLRGTKGVDYYIVDSKQRLKGRYKEGIKDIAPQKGKDLVLTIDSDVQKKAEELFSDRVGAVIAIEPETGEVIAFVSSPYFDLAALSASNSSKTWSKLTQDENKPLFNRVTMSRNPPGSTFKMITAIAGLEEGVIDTHEKFNCPGGYQYGDRFFKCTHVHGKVNLVSAIEKSCNTLFYQLILRVGLDKWANYARMFGFGSKTGIDLTEESAGIIPDSKYFDRAYGKGKWTSGYLLSLAIGQGDIIATPIQLAKYTAMLANFGKSKQPHILRGFIDENNNYIPVEYPEVKADVSRRTMEIVREGMFDVVNSVDGTATNIASKNLKIAGKTGTAQNPHGEDHALFVAFAPFDNPQIAVSVIVENVGYGSTHAAPIARELIRTYLTKISGNTNRIIADLKGSN